MGCPVVHFDIGCSDKKRTKEFYTALFDWSASEGPTPGYSMVDTGAGPDTVAGGIGAPQSPDDPGGIIVYLKVDDLQGTLDKAEKLGGHAVMPPTPLPENYGSIALLSDPDGNTVGIWA